MPILRRRFSAALAPLWGSSDVYLCHSRLAVQQLLHPLTIMGGVALSWGGALLGLMIAQKHWGCMPDWNCVVAGIVTKT